MTIHTARYPTLAIGLDAGYRTDDLRKLATLICTNVPSRKDERVEAIVSTMLTDLKGVFSQLSAIAQKAVSETVHSWGGEFQGRLFVNKYFASPYSQAKSKNNAKSGDLLCLFLIYGHMPADLLEKLKDVVPQPPENNIIYLNDAGDEPDDDLDAEFFGEESCVLRKTSQAALENLATLLTLVADKQVSVSANTGRATAATVRKITDLLYDGDWYNDEIEPMQSFAWPLLLQGGKLAKADGSFLQLTPAGRKAMKSDLAGGIKTTWERWEKTKIIDEFSRVTAIKGQKSSRGRTMTSPVKRRPMLNFLLEDLEPGRWISVDELFRVMQSDSLYLFDMVNYQWKLYITDQHYGHIDHENTWPLLQFRYLLVYLLEYCATLGICDVVYKSPHFAREDFRVGWGTDELTYLSHCDGLEYIRINDLGAFVFGHTDEYEVDKSTDKVFSFDGLNILYLGENPIPPGQGLYLDKIAERKEVDSWRLSVSSLLTAISGGEDLAQIKTMLTSASTQGVGREIEELLTDVERRSTAFVNVGQTTLIECSTEFYKQALSDKKLRNLCLPAGKRHLVILPTKEEKFAEALVSAGFIIGRKT